MRQNDLLLHVLLVESARPVRLAPVLQSKPIHLISTTRDIYLFSLSPLLPTSPSQLNKKATIKSIVSTRRTNSPNLTLRTSTFARRFSAPRRAPPLERSSSPALHRLLSSSHSEIHLLTHENLSTVRTETLYTCTGHQTNLHNSFWSNTPWKSTSWL